MLGISNSIALKRSVGLLFATTATVCVWVRCGLIPPAHAQAGGVCSREKRVLLGSRTQGINAVRLMLLVAQAVGGTPHFGSEARAGGVVRLLSFQTSNWLPAAAAGSLVLLLLLVLGFLLLLLSFLLLLLFLSHCTPCVFCTWTLRNLSLEFLVCF